MPGCFPSIGRSCGCVVVGIGVIVILVIVAAVVFGECSIG